MKTITVKDLLNGYPNSLTKDKIKQAMKGSDHHLTTNATVTVTQLNTFLKAHGLNPVSASDILQAIYYNLNDEMINSIQDYGICEVSDLEELLIDSLKELHSTDGLAYGFSISALYALLDYKDSDFVEYNNGMVNGLDFITLMGALNIE